jgi:hypothetical protein
MHPVPTAPNITALIHIKEIIFISNTGAVQVHKRVVDKSLESYASSFDTLMLNKLDNFGSEVWG